MGPLNTIIRMALLPDFLVYLTLQLLLFKSTDTLFSDPFAADGIPPNTRNHESEGLMHNYDISSVSAGPIMKDAMTVAPEPTGNQGRECIMLGPQSGKDRDEVSMTSFVKLGESMTPCPWVTPGKEHADTSVIWEEPTQWRGRGGCGGSGASGGGQFRKGTSSLGTSVSFLVHYGGSTERSFRFILAPILND